LSLHQIKKIQTSNNTNSDIFKNLVGKMATSFFEALFFTKKESMVHHETSHDNRTRFCRGERNVTGIILAIKDILQNRGF
jgi:hypothetical protein